MNAADSGVVTPTTTPASAEHSALLPVVVGVTGHRDLRPEDEPDLAAAVREFFAELRRRLPSTPIVLVSPLAEGADRLVARVFLDAHRGDPRHRLIVPLPMPLAEYRKDFQTPDSMRDFDELLRAGEVLPLFTRADQRGAACGGAARDLLYQRVGAQVARYSHFMIALWDGVSPGKTGGTAEVVRFRLEGLPESYLGRSDPLDPPECGPVYHVYTARASAPGEMAVRPATATMLYPAPWGAGKAAASAQAQVLEELDTFNRDAATLRRALPDRIETSRGRIVPAHGAPELSAAERHILDVFSAADAMATRYQSFARRVVIGLIGIALAAVLANQVYADFVKDRWAAGVYLALLALGGAVLMLADRFNWQHKHFNYRALAEGLRVQFFWRVADVPLSAADGYLRGQRPELQGVRQGLRFGDLLSLDDPKADPTTAVERLRFVRTRWLEDQRRYFVGLDGHGGAVSRDKGRLRRVSWVTRGAFAVGCFSVLLLLLWHPQEDWVYLTHQGRSFLGANLRVEIRDVLLGLVALAFASAAAAAGYRQVMGFTEHVRRGSKAGELFDRADARLRALLETADPELHITDAQRVLSDIGKEALAENGDWVILHRERPWEFSPG